MIDKVFKIFVDFDGTITRKDVGEHMFLEFGNPEVAKEVIRLWMEGEITSIDTWTRLCRTIPQFEKEKFNAFLDTIEIEEGFIDFVAYCKEHNFQLCVLSDGLDYYIKYILAKHGIDSVKVFSNGLTFNEKNELLPFFPYRDEDCNSCANCKRNHILDSTGDDEYSFYIGDGLSDTCPAQYTDFVFAKNSLLKYCEKNGINFFPFRNFIDVRNRIEEFRNKKRIKRKLQPELKRKEIFQQG
jgi:2,3-diketo-5-methylthio-1-phosphopentane phosphatase